MSEVRRKHINNEFDDLDQIISASLMLQKKEYQKAFTKYHFDRDIEDQKKIIEGANSLDHTSMADTTLASDKFE